LLENEQLARILQVDKGLPAQRIAEAYLTLGQTARAADALRRASSNQPSDPKLRIRHGQTLIRARRYDNAIDVARGLIREFPDVAEGTELLVNAYEAAGRSEDALADLRALATEQSDNVALTLTLADTLSARGRHEQAARALLELIDRQPEALAAYWKLASIRTAEGNIDAVVDIAARAVRANEHGHAEAATFIGELPGKRPDAVRNYLAGPDRLSRAGGDYAYGFMLGTLAAAADPAEFTELAEKAFRASVDVRADFIPAYLALGRIYLARYAWAQAIEIGRAAAEQDKKLPAIERLIGQGHDGLDAHDQAVEHYSAALRLNPRDTTTLWLLANLFTRLGEANKAQQRYLELLRIEPGHDEARQALFELYLARQELDNAQRQIAAMRKEQTSARTVGRCEALLALRTGRDTAKDYRDKLTELLASHGEDAGLRISLAQSHWLENDLEAALDQIERAKQSGPLPPAGLEVHAIVHQQRLDFDACDAVYKSMLERHPNRRNWIEGLYHLERIRQRYDKATEVLEDLLARNTGQRRINRYRRWLLLTLQRRNLHTEAITRARAWHGASPDDAVLRTLLTDALHAADRSDEAIALARTWYEPDPTQVEARMILLNTLNDAERVVEAQQLLLDWLADDPNNVQIIEWFYVVLRSAERYDDAIEWLRNMQSAAEQPGRRRNNGANLNQRLALAYASAKRYDEAVSLLRSMLREQDKLPVSVKLQFNEQLATVLRAAKRFDEAETHLQTLIESLPDGQTSIRTRLRRLLTFVYQQSGRTQSAEREMLAILEDAPRDVGVSNDLGYSWADAGKNIDRAEQMIRFALGQQPDQMAYLDSLGWVLYKKGAFAEAKLWLLRAVTPLNITDNDPLSGPTDPVVLDHLGDTLWRLGEREAAAERWREAIKVFEARRDDASSDELEARKHTEGKLAAVANKEPPQVAEAVLGDGAAPQNESSTNKEPQTQEP
jgi:tetratricopeptide (TPR) repeat protein